MKRINPEHVQRVIEMANKSPFLNHMGIHMEEMREGYARSIMPVGNLLNAFGGIHGGAYAALLDNVTYWALYCSVDEGMGYTTIDLTVSDLHSTKGGTVICEGRVIKHGRTISLTEAEVRDESGKLLAHATSKLFASPSVQPISAAVEATGSDPLPPKFLDGE